jgi:hypothetical protein
MQYLILFYHSLNKITMKHLTIILLCFIASMQTYGKVNLQTPGTNPAPSSGSGSGPSIYNHTGCEIRVTEVCYDINAQPVPFVYPSTTFTYGATFTITGWGTMAIPTPSCPPGNYVAYEVGYENPCQSTPSDKWISEMGTCCGWGTPMTPPIFDNHGVLHGCSGECGDECWHFDLNTGDLHLGY